VIRAIDVSTHQGRIDWPAVKASGVQAVWVKVGGADGGHYRDGRAGENLAGVEAVGLPFGTYYFCSPSPGSAVDQARHAVTCGHGRGALWPAADLETNPHGMSNEQLDRWLGDFCAEVMRLTGRESIWYGNFNTGVGFTTRAPECPCWIANYGNDRPGTTPPAFTPRVPSAWSTWDVWQFNSTTRVPGVTANTVDQNVISDAFWARMTSGATTPTAHEEDDMINWRPVHCPNETGDLQWMLVWDGEARPRRLPLGPGDPGFYWGLGWLQDTTPIVKTGAEAARFLALPVAEPQQPIDPVALAAALRQPLVDVVTAVLQAQHVDVDEHAVAQAVVDELDQRLQG